MYQYKWVWLGNQTDVYILFPIMHQLSVTPTCANHNHDWRSHPGSAVSYTLEVPGLSQRLLLESVKPSGDSPCCSNMLCSSDAEVVSSSYLGLKKSSFNVILHWWECASPWKGLGPRVVSWTLENMGQKWLNHQVDSIVSGYSVIIWPPTGQNCLFYSWCTL